MPFPHGSSTFIPVAPVEPDAPPVIPVPPVLPPVPPVPPVPGIHSDMRRPPNAPPSPSADGPRGPGGVYFFVGALFLHSSLAISAVTTKTKEVPSLGTGLQSASFTPPTATL